MKPGQKKGYFVISLDFELFWGMIDKTTIAEYGPNVAGERQAIPRMLEVFKKHGIHATWAGVGMLMARNKTELQSFLPPPHLRPVYADKNLSTYVYLENHRIGEDEETDIYHFAPSLVKMILSTPHQEWANHTFSHYYCIDGDDNPAEIFARDLDAHIGLSRTYGVDTESMVFPRNQTTALALEVCAQKGIRAYRGNENHFLYRARRDREQSPFIRGLRLLDHYMNISGHHTYTLPYARKGEIMNIPASRFFRPWNRSLRFFEWLRLFRIKRSMTYAAKHGRVFHLWWHPHNFGINQGENFKNLEVIMHHYELLKRKYAFESASMKEIATLSS